MPFILVHPLYLLVALLLVPLLKLWSRRQPTLGHSGTGMHKNIRAIPLLGLLPALLLSAAWLSMTVALAKPVVPHVSEKRTIDTRDIIIAMDISGSMSEPFDPSAQSSDAAPVKTKQDVAAESIRYFVEHRQGDRVALAVFDDDTYWHWPLTDDLSVIIKKTYLLNKYEGGGTNFDGPDPNGYESGIGPIQAAIDHFKAYSTSKTKVFVMVTDGSATISPARFAELSSQMRALGVKMYVIGVGSDWTGGDPGTNDLRRFVKEMDGTLITAGNAAELQAGIDSINKTEKSAVQLEKNTQYTNIAWYFMVAALFFVLGHLLTNSTTRRMV